MRVTVRAHADRLRHCAAGIRGYNRRHSNRAVSGNFWPNMPPCDATIRAVARPTTFQENRSMQKKPSDKPRPQRVRPVLAHQVRIIGGRWKRTPLPVLAADGLRPTPDRVRETVFNWLTHVLDGHWETVRCLDLFAGTGALGFEAASRGAASVLMVEAHTPAVRQLEATRDKLGAAEVNIVRGDALTTVQGLIARSGLHQFDLIFLDPPYHQDWLAKMLPFCRSLLAAGGILYVEAENALGATDQEQAAPAWLEGWAVLRADRAGMVFYHLLQCKNTALVEA